MIQLVLRVLRWSLFSERKLNKEIERIVGMTIEKEIER